MKLNIINLNRMDYNQALEIQLALQQKRIDGEIDDTLIIVEHPPVLTMGKRGIEENILVPQSVLDAENIQTVWINRGGDVTYHGPGQIVGYPIISLVENNLGIRVFVDKIQETIIKLLDENYGLSAEKKSGVHTGVWVDEKKITAIGISVRHGVTLHGFAFNVNTNLSHFDYINPCGLGFGMVTSLEKITSEKCDYDNIVEKTVEYFCREFEAQAIKKDIKELL